MTPEAIAALIIGALQELESNGIITIGGWDPAKVGSVLATLGTVLSKAFAASPSASPNAPGQSTPPGTQTPVGS